MLPNLTWNEIWNDTSLKKLGAHLMLPNLTWNETWNDTFLKKSGERLPSWILIVRCFPSMKFRQSTTLSCLSDTQACYFKTDYNFKHAFQSQLLYLLAFIDAKLFFQNRNCPGFVVFLVFDLAYKYLHRQEFVKLEVCKLS